MPKSDNKAKALRKEAIMKAAMSVFVIHGYSGTSTTEICEAGHVNKATLFYYFGSKRNLFSDIHKKYLADILEPFMDAASQLEDPYERYIFLIREFTKIVCKHPELRMLIHETLSIRDSYFDQIREKWKRHYLLLRDTISELQSQRRFDPDLKPSWTALLLLGMVTWITFWFDYSREDENDEVVETTVKTACALIR
jgi:AcrR family transcriptional regulator